MSEAKAAGGATKTPPAPAAHRFGFCGTEASHEDGHIGDASAWHARCPGALTSPSGVVVVCTCLGHGAERKCHVCLTEVEASEEYDAVRRKHADREACEIAASLRAEAARRDNDLTAQLAQLREETAARRRAERQAQNAIRIERGERPVAVREKKPPKAPQRCHDGCGGMTKGGMFLPGHDAKLKSALATEGGNRAAYVAQFAERIARGWLPPGGDPSWAEVRPEMVDTAQEAQALVDGAGGPEQYIAARVAERYKKGGRN